MSLKSEKQIIQMFRDRLADQQFSEEVLNLCVQRDAAIKAEIVSQFVCLNLIKQVTGFSSDQAMTVLLKMKDEVEKSCQEQIDQTFREIFK